MQSITTVCSIKGIGKSFFCCCCWWWSLQFTRRITTSQVPSSSWLLKCWTVSIKSYRSDYIHQTRNWKLTCKKENVQCIEWTRKKRLRQMKKKRRFTSVTRILFSHNVWLQPINWRTALNYTHPSHCQHICIEYNTTKKIYRFICESKHSKWLFRFVSSEAQR